MKFCIFWLNFEVYFEEWARSKWSILQCCAESLDDIEASEMLSFQGGNGGYVADV